MIALTTHLEKPVINNPLIDWHFTSLDGCAVAVHCNECHATETLSDAQDAMDWSDVHLCPWNIDPTCGVAMSEHIDGRCAQKEIER